VVLVVPDCVYKVILSQESSRLCFSFPFSFAPRECDRSSISYLRHKKAMILCLPFLQTLHDISLPCIAAKANGMMLKIVDGVSIIHPRTSSNPMMSLCTHRCPSSSKLFLRYGLLALIDVALARRHTSDSIKKHRAPNVYGPISRIEVSFFAQSTKPRHCSL
jgi:hypothetical protein